MVTIEEPGSGWGSLTPELVRKVASKLHANECAASLKLISSQTAAALRDFHTITLGQPRDNSKPIPEEPWPGPAFVAHWGRPEPWRALTLPQRERLLCLAASSGHVPSLEAALVHSGCCLKPQVLTSAAAAGNLAGCERLLAEGCSFSPDAITAAAATAHLPTLQLLLEAAGNELRPPALAAAAKTACCHGYLPVLTWLQQAYGYCYAATWNAEAAASAGQVALLEHMLGAVAQYAEEELVGEGEGGEDEGADQGEREPRWQLLVAVARGCPLAVLQQHYGRLWAWRGMYGRAGAPAEAAATPCDAAAGAATTAATTAADSAACSGPLVPREFAGEDDARDELLVKLLTAVASSPTPCWRAKLDWLLDSCWGAAVAEQVANGDRGGLWGIWESAAERPDFLERLQRLQAAGVPVDDSAVEAAAGNGRADALTYLREECGLEMDVGEVFTRDPGVMLSCSSDVRMLELLRERGAVFTAAHVRRAAERQWPAGSLVWLAEAAVDGGKEGLASVEREQQDWSAAFARAARSGEGLPLLRALRARGAVVDLGAVAAGGGEDAMEWALAELLAGEEAEHKPGDGGGGGGSAQQTPKHIIDSGADLARAAFTHGNVATLRWLAAHLRPWGMERAVPLVGQQGMDAAAAAAAAAPQQQRPSAAGCPGWLPPLEGLCASVRPRTFHQLQLWGQLRTQPQFRPLDALESSARVAAAAAGGDSAAKVEEGGGIWAEVMQQLNKVARDADGPPVLEWLLLPHQAQWVERQM
ncbi:hypothetical protein HYH02_002562 [Chlamydomonas schloesseri]|uniref:Uncharacterized protein n=1 Tax=Chlamydomonas schloesseri TaxID=2026947 RepID=A0A835WS90_9CHLO|nr:hypothetical protein HYH02_002562 [Chlamydomonas schloesseri]|eukprot:KAG2453239.1 hypothetical protein HYH02_002562 [Chlamydomonas schloesseri]